MMMWSPLETDRAPKPIAPYSQGVDAGSFAFVSGQLGLDPETNELPEDVEEETRRALEHVGAVLEAAGLSAANVVKTTIYMTDLDDYAGMNAAYAAFFSDGLPARAVVGVADLLVGARVEIEAVALYPVGTKRG